MLYWLIIIPIALAVFLYVLPLGRAGKLLAAGAQCVLLGCAFNVFTRCRGGELITRIGSYEGILGITLRADGLSSVFVMLTAFIFLIIAIYSLQESFSGLFCFLLFIWEALLIGIFLSDDLFNIFVLIEVVTVVVSILIMFNRDKRSMYDGMLYLMVNTVAIQFYLFGVGYLYKLTGSLDMSGAAAALAGLDKSALILPYALIMTAVSLKCALVPLFSWLPKAHGTPGAPAAVSAILSGLHIKTSLYIFIRVQEMFGDVMPREVFLVIGIATGVVGFVFALSKTDIKLILAYHTISQIGMIMIGLSSAELYAYTGGIYHIINHALFKSALFLSAGIISSVYGTRDLYKIRGVLRRIPGVGAATLLAALGITGAPFFNGSISKYFIMSGANWAVSGAVMLINLGTIISFIKYSTMLFGSADVSAERARTGKFKQAAILILGVFCLAGGIFGERAISWLFGVELGVDTAGYIQKAVLFILSAAAGLAIYKYYVKNSALLKRIRELELSFRATCISIGAFFAALLLAARLL